MIKKNYFNQLLMVIIFLVSACGSLEQADFGEEEVLQSQQPVVSWEEFEKMSRFVLEEEEFYIVEWDLPIYSKEELREYYEVNILKSKKQPDVQFLTVNTINLGAQDDIWDHEERYQLYYCISESFDYYHYWRAVSEMQLVTAEWEAVADVEFIHIQNPIGGCDSYDDYIEGQVLFRVTPLNTPEHALIKPDGISFFPSDYPGLRELLIDFDLIDSRASSVSSLGVFRHELGHILGLRHEHFRFALDDPEAAAPIFDANPICTLGGAFDVAYEHRFVTEYDVNSVMHYPACGVELPDTDLIISALDEQGIQELYPLDTDQDGISDAADNCLYVDNFDQIDTDKDGQGNVCDPDDDNDGMSDVDELLVGRNPLINEPAVLHIIKSLLFS